MEIYIEYAFLENFLYDFALLWLAFFAAQVKAKRGRLCLSATLGGVFALLFPLLSLSKWQGTVLKLATGAVLCLLAFGRIYSKKRWEKYILVTLLFFAFGFGFGGTLLVVYGPLSIGEKVPSFAVFLGFAVLMGIGIFLVKVMYARRSARVGIYTCSLIAKEKCLTAEGFYDSGNLAVKDGIPVCFLSPAIFYELYGEEILKGSGQVCVEMQISTLAGNKKVVLYQGEIEVEGVRSVVYYAPSTHIIGKEYGVLINARVKGEWDAID